jgi:type IV pilus assembly protein PilW
VPLLEVPIVNQKIRHGRTRSSQQRGLTLVEMMVSLTIGMVLIVSLVGAYLGTSGSGKVTEALGRMNEDAQSALSLLSQQLRMAGSNPIQANRDATQVRNALSDTFFVFGCDGGASNVGATPTSSITCVTSNTGGPDSISIAYEADAYNTIPTGSGIPTDCLGQSLPSQTMVVGTGSAVFYEVQNQYFISKPAGAATPSLYCAGSGAVNNPQAMVENIEDMQFTYGVSAPAAGTGTIAGYMTASEIAASADLAVLGTSQAKWSRVVSVKICLLMTSFEPVLNELTPYYKCDGTLETAPADLRLRRAYTTTVLLRNLVAAP